MSLCIRNVPIDIDKKVLIDQFEKFGSLEKVEILSNDDQRTDAFLLFTDPRDAADAYHNNKSLQKRQYKSWILDFSEDLM